MPPYIDLPPKLCLHCGLSFGRDSCRQLSDFRAKKFCSRSCSVKHIRGPRHHNWRGGTKTRLDGYVRNSRTDEYLHRIVMSEKLGRSLKSSEFVHHIDGNPENNNLANLELMTNSEHAKRHSVFRVRNALGQFA